jgi:hypothetical protein
MAVRLPAHANMNIWINYRKLFSLFITVLNAQYMKVGKNYESNSGTSVIHHKV